ncbi:MAG: cytidine deaminase [Fimbriimonadaceae bacterium]
MQYLLSAAADARLKAYAPYSNYQVGAAVEDENGAIHVGCNVENISYGGTICAERSAVSRMIEQGGRRIVAVAVVTVDGGTPCGLCRQVISEFADDATLVIMSSTDPTNPARTCLFDELFPDAFKSALVLRTDGP